jgi:hypothetical protein
MLTILLLAMIMEYLLKKLNILLSESVNAHPTDSKLKTQLNRSLKISASLGGFALMNLTLSFKVKKIVTLKGN